MVDFKCEYCNKKTEMIYETDSSIFFQCIGTHLLKVPKNNNLFTTKKCVNPVFMVKKEVKV